MFRDLFENDPLEIWSQQKGHTVEFQDRRHAPLSLDQAYELYQQQFRDLGLIGEVLQKRIDPQSGETIGFTVREQFSSLLEIRIIPDPRFNDPERIMVVLTFKVDLVTVAGKVQH